MKDSEFYTLEENWPQPPDDPCTLEAASQGRGEAKKKKKLSSAKVRKKMSESLAGVTAAAVAVVMVATAIPSLKDAFDDLPDLPDFTLPELDYVSCPVCERPNCPYFEHVPEWGIAYGIDVRLDNMDSTPDYGLGEDIFTISGFLEDDLLHEREQIIITEKKERIILVRSKSYDWPNGSTWHWVDHNPFMYDPSSYAYTGLLVEMEDEKSPNDTSFALINLVYDPAGQPQQITVESICERSNIDIDPANAEYYTVEINDHPNIQLQFASDLGMDYLQELAGLVYVDYVKEIGLTYSLGETMYFTETQQIYRDYMDNLREGGGLIYNSSNTVTDDQYFLGYGFYKKYYRFRGSGDAGKCQIIFSPVAWDTVFDRWDELNAEAPEYGHEVYFPVVEMEDVTVNGIDYSTFAVYSTVSLQPSSDFCYLFECYFVPKQENNIAICVHSFVLEENIQKFQEMLHNEYVDIGMDFLQQITLR